MDKVEKFFEHAQRLVERLERLLPGDTEQVIDDAIAWRWRKSNGQARLNAVTRFNPITLSDLLHIDRQKSKLVQNTRQFLARLPANNALLWGPRGTGKSSLIKALLNDHAKAGLRLIEVDRLDLTDLPDIVDRLHDNESRFIIYCDDLTFDENDATYRALKTVLDGSVLDTPENVLIYATSNRRHLVPEYHADNLGTQQVDGELHHSEAVEEKISLSERFGLWLSFHPFNQEQYLDVTMHWLRVLEADLSEAEKIRDAALQWSLLHGSRSGRSAYQFALDWAGRASLYSGNE